MQTCIEFINFEKKLASYLAWLFSYNQIFFDYIVAPRINAIKPNIDQRYRDEIDGIISGLVLSNMDTLGDGQLSMNEMWALQLIPDTLRGTNCSGFGVFGNCSASGSPIVGRKLDWSTNEDARSIRCFR